MTISFDAVWIPWVFTAVGIAASLRRLSRADGFDFEGPLIALLWVIWIATAWAVYFAVTR